ncbi:hypothetical protein MTR67_035733 [Solanum verrucosum]|uniref:Uncharacterized protein n=1 Tax=Solanum verrucosum TaxID=315347 RepID=A0AAF0ZLR9_SOLVR|nr:hypothetical protein MTR67_035733 [Solanum verrucosum]
MQEGSPLTMKCSTGSTVRRMPILVNYICIIRRCRPTGISTLNVRVCELEC